MLILIQLSFIRTYNCFFRNQEETPEDVGSVLKEHFALFPITCVPEIANRFVIRRKHIWKDAIRAMSRSTFSPRNSIEVTFVGEDAIDDGGVSREFFDLALKEMAADGTILQGPMHSRSFIHNTKGFSERRYYYAGLLVAVSLANGGPGLCCLSEAVFSYLCYGLPLRLELKTEDLTDFELIEKLNKV